jgi:hypothetical protein
MIVVVMFDMHDPAIAIDPHPTYGELRARCPVSWSTAWGGFWFAARRAEVVDGARSGGLRTTFELPDGSLQGISIPSLGQSGRLLPLEVDPPRAAEIRRLLAPRYAPRQVAADLPELGRLAQRCVDDVIEEGAADLVVALTSRLPALVVFRELGLPQARWRHVVATIHRALLTAPREPDEARDAALEVCLEIVDAMEAQRAGVGRGGLIADLLQATIDGVPLPGEEIVSIVYLLLLGIDPTSTLTATALWQLARLPELRRRLIADRALLPQAAEEFLRWVSPVQGTARTAHEEVELGGCTLRRGERVVLSWASANRDERCFSQPDRIDVDRQETSHLAFGTGAHFCLGAAAVRAQFCTMADAVLTRLPDYEVDEAGVDWFPDLSSVYGVRRLPVRFTPGPRLADDPL